MYLWMKWLHIIAIISWMAGILYLYRLLINHRERTNGSLEIHQLLCGMEFRLYRYITLPAMYVALFAGTSLIVMNPSLLDTGWLKVKLTMVFLLFLSTYFAGFLVQKAKIDSQELPSGRLLRFANEVPTLLMMAIVWLVVFKSF